MAGSHKYHLENRMYKTTGKGDTIIRHKGHPENHTLLLQPVEGKDCSKLYWLAWYDKDGKPTVGGGSVFGKRDIPNMIEALAKLIDINVKVTDKDIKLIDKKSNNNYNIT